MIAGLSKILVKNIARDILVFSKFDYYFALVEYHKDLKYLTCRFEDPHYNFEQICLVLILVTNYSACPCLN